MRFLLGLLLVTTAQASNWFCELHLTRDLPLLQVGPLMKKEIHRRTQLLFHTIVDGQAFDLLGAPPPLLLIAEYLSGRSEKDTRAWMEPQLRAYFARSRLSPYAIPPDRRQAYLDHARKYFSEKLGPEQRFATVEPAFASTAAAVATEEHVAWIHHYALAYQLATLLGLTDLVEEARTELLYQLRAQPQLIFVRAQEVSDSTFLFGAAFERWSQANSTSSEKIARLKEAFEGLGLVQDAPEKVQALLAQLNDTWERAQRQVDLSTREGQDQLALWATLQARIVSLRPENDLARAAKARLFTTAGQVQVGYLIEHNGLLPWIPALRSVKARDLLKKWGQIALLGAEHAATSEAQILYFEQAGALFRAASDARGLKQTLELYSKQKDPALTEVATFRRLIVDPIPEIRSRSVLKRLRRTFAALEHQLPSVEETEAWHDLIFEGQRAVHEQLGELKKDRRTLAPQWSPPPEALRQAVHYDEFRVELKKAAHHHLSFEHRDQPEDLRDLFIYLSTEPFEAHLPQRLQMALEAGDPRYLLHAAKYMEDEQDTLAALLGTLEAAYLSEHWHLHPLQPHTLDSDQLKKMTLPAVSDFPHPQVAYNYYLQFGKMLEEAKAQTPDTIDPKILTQEQIVHDLLEEAQRAARN